MACKRSWVQVPYPPLARSLVCTRSGFFMRVVWIFAKRRFAGFHRLSPLGRASEVGPVPTGRSIPALHHASAMMRPLCMQTADTSRRNRPHPDVFFAPRYHPAPKPLAKIRFRENAGTTERRVTRVPEWNQKMTF